MQLGTGGRTVKNWSDAFANAVYIEGAEEYPKRWSDKAMAFRQCLVEKHRAKLNIQYSEEPRNLYDLFMPENDPIGLVIFVHGGFWRTFDKDSWSHLAIGSIDRGYAVAIVSYTLCPEAGIADITREISQAVTTIADTLSGPIHLLGHSAGGHLICRMLCLDVSLGDSVNQRIKKCVSISGVHDLRPLIHTEMNCDLGIDLLCAQAESPVLLPPREKIDLCCWVGADERSEFIRQSRLLADMWCGFDVTVDVQIEPGMHHFNVIDGMCDARSEMMKTLFE